jgi:hypothetical protein
MADMSNAESLAVQLRDFIRSATPKQQQRTRLQGGFQQQVFTEPAKPPRNIETRAQIYKNCLVRLTTEEQRDALDEVISGLEQLLIGS